MSYIASWSGGKDGCFAVYQALQQGYKISHLVNFISRESQRVSAHGLMPGLVKLQSERIGIPLVQKETTHDGYEQQFKEVVNSLIPSGVEGMVFGDIYVQEHLDWIQRVCNDLNIKAFEPLWDRNTEDIMADYVNAGFKSVIIAAKSELIDENWIGKIIDKSYLDYLRNRGIDVCGENGEYHTLVIDGPLFKKPINLLETRVIKRDNLWFLDIVKYK
jgi:diphthine-ammonia ligase